jgi:hypothetical protein
MSKLVPSMRQSFLALYTSLGPAYIVLIALPYRTAVLHCYLVPIADLSVFNTLTPYLRAACTILDLGEYSLGTVLKMQPLLT